MRGVMGGRGPAIGRTAALMQHQLPPLAHRQSKLHCSLASAVTVHLYTVLLSSHSPFTAIRSLGLALRNAAHFTFEPYPYITITLRD